MSSNINIAKTCVFCGEQFTAKTTTTQYCSHACSQKAYKERKRQENKKSSHNSKLLSTDTSSLYMKEYLSLREAAIVLGVGKSTAHRYCVAGMLKCIKMNKLIFVRKKDIDGMFEYAPSYRVTPRPERITKPKVEKKPHKEEVVSNIEDYASAAEIAKMYGYSKSSIHKIAASKGYSKITRGCSFLYRKRDFELELAEKCMDDDISNWYNVEEIKEIYKMTTSAVYTLTSKYGITRKTHQGKALYLKSEIDAMLRDNLGDESITEWYSSEDIYNRFHFEGMYLANFVFVNKIPKRREGKKVFYSKSHFDQVVEEKRPQTEYVTVERATEMYGMSRDALYAFIKRNSIPKINDGPIIKIQRSAMDAIFNTPYDDYRSEVNRLLSYAKRK